MKTRKINLSSVVAVLAVYIAAFAVSGFATAIVRTQTSEMSEGLKGSLIVGADPETECCKPSHRWGCACSVKCQGGVVVCVNGTFDVDCDEASCELSLVENATCTLQNAFRKGNRCKVFNTLQNCPNPPAQCPGNTGPVQCEYTEIPHNNPTNNNTQLIHVCTAGSTLCPHGYAVCD